MRKALARLKS